MPDPMTTPPRMTAVFEYDLKQHPGNPFHTDTPFGRPLVLQPGDFSEAEAGEDAEPTPDALSLLRAYEAWEAALITDGDWTGELPTLTQPLFDELMRLQGLRNEVLAKLENRHDR